MSWLLLCVFVAVTIAVALIAWRKWIAPWREVEELVTQIARGERPRTFLVHDGAQAHRIGLRLEKIFHDLKQLDKQIAKRESGLQTIFFAMQDALLVVDSDRRVVLANEAFRKLFALPEISAGTPLLDSVRDATLSSRGVPDEISGSAKSFRNASLAKTTRRSESTTRRASCIAEKIVCNPDSRLATCLSSCFRSSKIFSKR